MPDSSVVAIHTHIGEPLIIRANPTDESVRGFVVEHTRRFLAREPGGPSGTPAFLPLTARRFDNEEAFLDGEFGTEIDISDLLPTP